MSAVTQMLDIVRRLESDRFGIASQRWLTRARQEAPFKSGDLSRGLVYSDTDTTGPVYSATVVSQARSLDGRDYGAILNDPPPFEFIEPVAAKALKWIDEFGEHFAPRVRVSRIHEGWFDDLVDEWPQTLQDTRVDFT